MNVIDLTQIPAKVIITNNFKADPSKKVVIPVADVKVEEGATKPGAVDMVENSNVSMSASGDIKIQMFGTNLWLTLPAGDSVELIARTSSELLYYVSKKNSCDFLDVSVTEDAEKMSETEDKK